MNMRLKKCNSKGSQLSSRTPAIKLQQLEGDCKFLDSHLSNINFIASSKNKIVLKKGNVFDTLVVEKHKPQRFLMKEFNEIEEV